MAIEKINSPEISVAQTNPKFTKRAEPIKDEINGLNV